MTDSPRTPPTGAARLFLRAPIWLYRLRLGWLLRDRFVLLHHIGRRTGQRREAVVEVVRRDGDALVICSGFDQKSQWYRNVMAHPDIAVTLARSTYPVHAERLGAPQAAAEMMDYAARHPESAKRLSAAMGFPGDGSEQTYRRVGEVLPFLRLEPR